VASSTTKVAPAALQSTAVAARAPQHPLPFAVFSRLLTFSRAFRLCQPVVAHLQVQEMIGERPQDFTAWFRDEMRMLGWLEPEPVATPSALLARN
jgi:hypothetical protein